MMRPRIGPRPRDGRAQEVLAKRLEQFLAKLAQVEEVKIDLPDALDQLGPDAQPFQPRGKVVGAASCPPPRLVNVEEQRPQRHALDRLDQFRGRLDALPRVVGDQPRLDQRQLKPRPRPGHAVRAPQPPLDQIDQPCPQRRHRFHPVRIHQPKLLPQGMIADPVPAPARQIVGEFVELEVVVQHAPHHVVLEDDIGRGMKRLRELPQIDANDSRCLAHQTAIVHSERIHAVHPHLLASAPRRPPEKTPPLHNHSKRLAPWQGGRMLFVRR